MIAGLAQRQSEPAHCLRPPSAAIPADWPRFRIALYWQLLRNYIDTWPARLYDDLVVDCSPQFPNTWLVSDPAIIRDVFKRDSTQFQACPQQRRICASLFGGPSIATTEGEDWAADRSNYEAALSPANLKSADAAIAGNAERLIESWAQQGETVRIDKGIARFALANIVKLALSWDASPQLDAIATGIDGARSSVGQISMAAMLQKLNFVKLNPRGEGAGALATLERMVDQEIAGRNSGRIAAKPDLLGAYLGGREPGCNSTALDRRARSNVLAFIAAGFDTTASSLTWFLYLLSLSPQAQHHVRNELCGPGSEGASQGITKFPYTRAALSEALRLYPPLPLLARTAMQDYSFGSVHIPRGSNVFVSPYLVHRHRRLWENPNEFDPERFLGSRRKEHVTGAYLPFGTGRRSCVGMQLAYREIVAATASILRTFDLAASHSHPVRVKSGMGLRAADGIVLHLSPRP